MRVSDLMMNNSFVNNVAKSKERINKLSKQLADGNKVQKPSDSPQAAARIIRLGTQSSQNAFYTKNIENSLAVGSESSLAMESVQEEISGVLTLMSQMTNPTNVKNYQSYSEKIDLSLKSVLDYANSQSNGKFIFGGTDHSAAPFGFSGDQSAMESKTNSSGDQIVRLSQNVLQKINMTGTEVFGTILKGGGNLNSGDAIGDTYTNNATIYNASKEAFNIQFTYTKTAANTYSLTYDITDSTSTSIYSTLPDPVELKYDPVSGKINTVDGQPSTLIKIQESSRHIDLSFDVTNIKEENSAGSIAVDLNQKTDIFNTLIRIKNDLANGIAPSDEDQQMVKDFNSRLLVNISTNGNITNQLTKTQDLLSNQKTTLDELTSSEQEIDTAKAIMELQNQDYLLQMAYKISASILPKSLLDYL